MEVNQLRNLLLNNMWCVIWKQNNLYKIFTNQIFESEQKAVEFKNKQKSMRKAHDCRAVPYIHDYFNGVSNLDHLNGSEKPQDS